MLGIDAIPSNFRVSSFEDGIEPEAYITLSDNLDRLMRVLPNSKNGQYKIKDKKENVYKMVSVYLVGERVSLEEIQYFRMNDN